MFWLINTIFSLTGEDVLGYFEGMGSFKYLVWVLYRSEEDWPEVRRNIWRAIQIWGRLGKFLSREGADPLVSEKFYHAVFQVVLIFGLETWVLTAAMLEKLEGYT